MDTESSSHLNVRDACHALLDPAHPHCIAVHAHRVMLRMLSDESCARVNGPDDVVAAFKGAGRIPTRLIESLRAARIPSDNAWAVAFAACIYQQRPSDLGDLLGKRTAEFGENHSLLNEDPVRAAAGLFDELRSAEAGELLADLTAAADLASIEHSTRLHGALLYLTTCTPNMRQIMVRMWRDCAGLVRNVRRYCNAPPTQMVPGLYDGLPPGKMPDLGRVVEGLARLLPVPAHEIESIVWLEFVSAREFRKRFFYEPLIETVAEFWDSQWEQLQSGFPYFAFQAKLRSWWIKCARQYELRRKIKTVPDHGQGATSPEVYSEHEKEEAPEVKSEHIRCLREGYRLVRTSFYAQKGGEPEIRNEARRRVVDDLWYAWTVHQLSGRASVDTHAQIGKRYGVPENTVNMLSHRLQLRMRAYSAARILKRTNNEIRSMRPDGWHGTSGPLAEEPGWESLATLARPIPTSKSLFWSFCARIGLQQVLLPNVPDPWTLDRFRCEWPHWRDQVLAEFDVYSQADDLASFERRLYAAWTIAQDTCAANSDRTFGALLAEGAGTNRAVAPLNEEEAESFSEGAAAFVHELTGALDWPERFAAYRKSWRELNLLDWAVPVWYAACVERVPKAELIVRLGVDRCDVERLNALIDAIVELLAVAQLSSKRWSRT